VRLTSVAQCVDNGTAGRTSVMPHWNERSGSRCFKFSCHIKLRSLVACCRALTGVLLPPVWRKWCHRHLLQPVLHMHGLFQLVFEFFGDRNVEHSNGQAFPPPPHNQGSPPCSPWDFPPPPFSSHMQQKPVSSECTSPFKS